MNVQNHSRKKEIIIFKKYLFNFKLKIGIQYFKNLSPWVDLCSLNEKEPTHAKTIANSFRNQSDTLKTKLNHQKL